MRFYLGANARNTKIGVKVRTNVRNFWYETC